MGTVSVIATASNTVVATVPLGTNPVLVAITPNGSQAYVTSYTGDAVSVIATASNTVVATVPVGTGASTGPYGVTVAPNGSFVYVTNPTANTVGVIATASNTVVNTVAVGSVPRGIAITPNGSYAYIANQAFNTVSVLSLLLTQVSPTTASATSGSAYSGQLGVSGSQGAVTYTTTTSNAKLSASSSGALSAPNTTPPGTYTVSGTDVDTGGDSGTWTFTLTVEGARRPPSSPPRPTPPASARPPPTPPPSARPRPPAPSPSPMANHDRRLRRRPVDGASTGKATCTSRPSPRRRPPDQGRLLGRRELPGLRILGPDPGSRKGRTTTALASSTNPATVGAVHHLHRHRQPDPDRRHHRLHRRRHHDLRLRRGRGQHLDRQSDLHSPAYAARRRPRGQSHLLRRRQLPRLRSSALTQEVEKATTTTALASSTNPSERRRGPTYTATVSPTPDRRHDRLHRRRNHDLRLRRGRGQHLDRQSELHVPGLRRGRSTRSKRPTPAMRTT